MYEKLENIGGVKCHRPLTLDNVRQHAPRIRDAWSEEKKFTVEDKNDPEKTIFLRYIDQGIVIEVFGTKVCFKRSRGKRFKDLREPNKSFSREEILSELNRMLADTYEADRAMTLLEFG